jgi:DNA-binding response OmpR family regulator
MEAMHTQWRQLPDSRYSILVIEDDLNFLDFICELLAASGFNVIRASSGDEGLGIFHEQNPDLVITDIVMPGTDGLDVITSIKESDPRTPVVAMAGLQNKPHKQSFLSLAVIKGADAVLAKPFNMDELRKTLSRLLDKRFSNSSDIFVDNQGG